MIKSKKVVIVGHYGVGKTSLIRRFVEDVFSEDYKVTIGVHILKKSIVINEETINLILWDTEGTDDIEEIRKAYLMGTHHFVLMCDVTRPATYENLDQQVEYLNEHFKNVPITKVGNKSDLLPKGSIGDKKKELHFLDSIVSAKEGNNVQRLFEKIARHNN